MGLALRVQIKGMAQLKAKLQKLKDDLQNPQVPLMQSAVQIQEETVRNFVEGGRPETWAPVSLMTLFIRAHRADGPKRTGGLPLNDTGRLKNSFVPFVGGGGTGFGVGTNVEYASLMQNGGVSDEQDVEISGYTRRLRQNQFTDFTTGTRNRIKTDKGSRLSSGKVRAYTMHLEGGKEIPARPFFPRSISELSDWGYQAKIKSIFWNYFNKDL